ncbi:MAG TPA: DUF3857 domain-containing protein [Spirochaetota bacterium]|nr:DUF3857 domain-containing protein [Spirochaetota bacterium]
MKKSVFPIIIASLLLSASAITGASGSVASFEKKILASYTAGDYSSLYQNIEQLVTAMPWHPVSLLYLPDLIYLADVFGTDRVADTLDLMKRNLVAAESVPDKDRILLQINLALEEILYQKYPEKGSKLTESLAPLRLWTIVGPLEKYGAGDLDFPFLPEKMIELAGTSLPVKTIVVKKSRGDVCLKNHVYPERGIVYALASFPVQGKIRIHLNSECRYRVFVNGSERAANTDGDYKKKRILEVSGTDAITLMIKIQAGETWDFRVILTDEHDHIVTPKLKSEHASRSPCDVSEIEDYPHDALVKTAEDPASIKTRLAGYFAELGSRKSLALYDEALALKDDPVVRYFQSVTMIKLAGHDRNSSLYARGWKGIKETASRAPDFIPARSSLLEQDFSDLNPVKSCRDGSGILSSSPLHFPTYNSCAMLLRYLGFEHEFHDLINKFKRAFPFSPYPWVHESQFYKNRDTAKEITALEGALKIKVSPDIIHELVSAYIKAGNLDEAEKTISRYNDDGSFNSEWALINTRRKNYSMAKEILFKEIIKRGSPDQYERLGNISMLDHADPVLYWLKTLSLDPSRFSLSDMMDYLNTGKFSIPLGNYFETVDPWEAGLNAKETRASATVLHRDRVLKIYHSGASRILCRDLVKINTEQGAEQWGEYRIPFEQKIETARVRVYSGKNSFTDHVRVTKVDNSTYLTIGSLKKGSVLEISYLAEDIFDQENSGMMLEFPVTFIQNYNEPVLNFSLNVICPPETELNFMLAPGLSVGKGFDGENTVYTLTAQNLEQKQREVYSGSAMNTLPFYSFSAMMNENDMIYWYHGLCAGKDDTGSAAVPEIPAGGELEETVGAVYSYVVREINLTANTIYNPGYPEDTLFNKRGSAEDRALLARALLKQQGIASYIALARSRFLPERGSYISRSSYSDILLFVPVDREHGLWLDFSSDSLACGMVNNSLCGTRALILLSENYEYRDIAFNEAGGKKSVYTVTVHQKGNADIAVKTVLSGYYTDIQKYFKDSRYHEEMIYSFFRDQFTSLDLINYSVVLPVIPGDPVTISMKGKENGLALTGKGKMILRPVLQSSSIYGYINYPERQTELIIEEPISEEDEYHFILPKTYLNALIHDKFTVESSFGRAEIITTKEKGSVSLNVYRKITVNAAKIKPQDYKDFLQFCLDLKAIEFKNITIYED